MTNRLPIWFKQELPSSQVLEFSDILHNKFALNTVCHSAKCPNISRCFSQRHATFLILGKRCTRHCRFCAIEHLREEDNSASFVDRAEPYKIAEACKHLNLDYVVITSVTRDDLEDGGAQHFADTMDAIKELSPHTGVELLIPDFRGKTSAVEKIINVGPTVLSHNIETVQRLYPLLRNKADYQRSLSLLKTIKSLNPRQMTKSSLMLGLGETDEDIGETLADLRGVDSDMVVIGQYLRPSSNHYSVQKFYTPKEFALWQTTAFHMGFKTVCASPLARTSYRAKEQYQCTMSSYSEQVLQA